MEVQKDARWRVVRDLPAGGIVQLRAPASGGFECVVPAGTVLRVENDPPSSATAVYCLPENYGELEPVLVPAEERAASLYNGYALVIKLAEFGDKLVPAE